MEKFETRTLTAANGYTYQVQVAAGAPLVETRTAAGVGTEELKAERRTEDKAERRTEDKAEHQTPAKRARPRAGRPGAAPRKTQGEG